MSVLAIAAAISVLYGIAFLLAPGVTLAAYGNFAPGALAILVARFFGVAMLSRRLVVWFVGKLRTGPRCGRSVERFYR